MKKRIYMDYAATTPVAPEVVLAMAPYMSKVFGNPSSIHAEGAEAKKVLDTARKSVAGILQAHSDEIVFTSGGTESNNLAILGTISAAEIADKRRTNVERRRIHVVTTTIEHSSILEPIRTLESRGVSVTYVPVEANGVVDPKKIIAALSPETVLVSVGYANNEIGTIQPILKIGKLLRSVPNRPLFHVDASQAPLYLDVTVERLGVDLMTLDGHKMYGPKGVGMLYVRRDTSLEPVLWGGGQERGIRPTTENVPAIVGFAKAFEIASKRREKETKRLAPLRDFCIASIEKEIPAAILNGDRENRLSNNVNFSFPGIDTEFTVLQLDAAGIACSTKSSCLGSEGASYVVAALGGLKSRADSTLRFTFGRDTTKKDIVTLVGSLKKILSSGSSSHAF